MGLDTSRAVEKEKPILSGFGIVFLRLGFTGRLPFKSSKCQTQWRVRIRGQLEANARVNLNLWEILTVMS